MPPDPYGDAADRRSAEDAAWREIVDNYGERPLLEGDDDQVARPGPTGPAPVPDPAPAVSSEPERAPRPEPAEEHYVPPPPPPLPRTDPPRLVAWTCLFGSPVVVLLALVAKVAIPPLLGLILMVGFVGGFVYLVASMRSEPRDDNDDGAVV